MKTTAPGYGDLPQATWKDTKQDVRKSTVSSGSVPGYGSKPVAQPNGALDDEIQRRCVLCVCVAWCCCVVVSISLILACSHIAIRKAQRTVRHRPARQRTALRTPHGHPRHRRTHRACLTWCRLALIREVIITIVVFVCVCVL